MYHFVKSGSKIYLNTRKLFSEFKFSRSTYPRNSTMSTNCGTAEVKHERDDRPKALRYADRINAMEEKILDGLPEIIDKLMSMAKEGNVPAARYLIDRMAGRPSRLPAPPSGDNALPYTTKDWTSDQIIRREQRESKTAAHLRALYNALEPAPSYPGIGARPTLDFITQELAYRAVAEEESGRRRRPAR